MSEAVAAGVTVRHALRDASAALEAAGCDTPRLDAELLLAAVLGVERGRLIIDSHRALGPAAVGAFGEFVRRREEREPIAYILGYKQFRRIKLAVTPHVLIPRPETELLVEAGLTLPRGARVVDVGTGSGAVALALKDERPDLAVVGTDVSADALAVAVENATRLNLDVRFERADLIGEGSYDAVLANLPYVADGTSLQPEIAEHEPAGALFAGADGLDLIRRLVATVGSVPVVGLEIGFDQAGAVESLLAAAGFHSMQRLRDLAGHERVIVGRRRRT